jgi:hypothetical protein
MSAGRDQTVVERLLPYDPDLDELANAIFEDTLFGPSTDVRISAIDQFLAALARQLLIDDGLGGVAVVQLPRAKHRCALMLAICAHLLCRRGQPPALLGPVVLVTHDLDLAEQLRHLHVRNHQRMGLARGNPLSAQRLTRSGEVLPALGDGRPPVDRSLIYFNTRVGVPVLRSRPPLVVIDATSITHPDARKRAIDWASDRGAVATILIADIGDNALTEAVRAEGYAPVVVPLTEDERKALVDELGPGTASASNLCSAGLLGHRDGMLRLHGVGSDELNDDLASAFAALATKPPGLLPAELDKPLKLLRSGTRLAATVQDYCEACSHNLRPGEGPKTLRRRLEGTDFRAQGSWHSWGITEWGTMKRAVLTLWRQLDASNPKLLALWDVLDDLDRTTEGPVLIRCHSRAAVEATHASLTGSSRSEAQLALWERLEKRLVFAGFKDRYEAGRFEAQVLTGAPPPWLFSVLLGAEAASTHVLAYGVEATTIKRAGDRWASELGSWRDATCRVFNATLFGPVHNPAQLPDASGLHPSHRLSSVPGLSIGDVLDRAELAINQADDQPGHAISAQAPGSRSCVPVRLTDARTWYCRNEGDETTGGDRKTPVLTITAAGHKYVPVGALHKGDRVVVPAGTGTESVHARLLALSRSNSEVTNLDQLLSQFRQAARSVLATSRTKKEAVERARIAGADAEGQLEAWASGTTIAPRSPGDVSAVFKAANRPCPDLAFLYAVAGTLRDLSARLKRFATAISSGRGDLAEDELRKLIGPAADELLDEFVVAEVESIGQTRMVPGSLAGRVL